jgi:hypothetical protein
MNLILNRKRPEGSQEEEEEEEEVTCESIGKISPQLKNY